MSEFGTDITRDDIIETLSFFDNWEDRYKYIIELGKELEPLAEVHRTEENLVRGCQSQVEENSAQALPAPKTRRHCHRPAPYSLGI